MKELFKQFKETEIVNEIKSEQDQKKEIKLIGRQRRIRGLILFEYNERTNTLLPAKFKTDDTVEITSLSASPDSTVHSSKVIVNDNCVYFQALNLKNARKKIGL